MARHLGTLRLMRRRRQPTQTAKHILPLKKSIWFTSLFAIGVAAANPRHRSHSNTFNFRFPNDLSHLRVSRWRAIRVSIQHWYRGGRKRGGDPIWFGLL